jgi:oligopeptide transport system substrate-binding protein
MALLAHPMLADDDWKKAHQPETDDWKEVEQHFIFNTGADPETLDPHQVTAMDSFRLVAAIFEGLYETDPKTLEPRLACAESHTTSKDQLVHRITLRKGLTWSDGRPLNTRDFMASFKRALAGTTAASYANLYFHVKGAETYHQTPDDKKSFDTVGLKAVDDLTLEFTLATPCPFFKELLTMPVFMPVRTDLIEKYGTQWTRPAKLVCNGPFLLKERKYRESLTFEPNPRYRDKAFVKLKKVTARCIDDVNTAYKHFLEGDIHWLPAIPQNRIDELKHNPDYYVSEALATYFMRFNVTKKPFDDARVRRAFVMATNSKTITDDLLRGGQKPVSTYCPKIGGYSPPKGLKYDVAKARKLLAQAGYANPATFPPIEISYNASEQHKMIAETLSQQWRKKLGVKATTRNCEWKVFLGDMKTLRYTICRSSWFGDYSDPSTFFDCFHSESGNNRTGWKNREYDELLTKTRQENDVAKRSKLFERMETILVAEECPIIPIYRYVDQGVLSESVLGWHQNIRSIHPLHFIWLE